MEFKQNIELKDFSNYKIGGPARFFFLAKSAEEVTWAISDAREKSLPIFILGGGTNILFSDKGFNGLVLKPELDFVSSVGNRIASGAGVSMAELLKYAEHNNLSGLEWAGGLPGTLGGAIRGNAGCFKGEMKDSIESVQSFDSESGEMLSRKNSECEFGYRSSIYKKNAKEIILSAVLAMQPGNKEEISASANEKIEYRKNRQPLEYPNIGSIFKNVAIEKFKSGLTDELKTHIKDDPYPLIPAAVLISQAGLKGRTVGGAQISDKHANFIVNRGGAKAADVLVLIEMVKAEILKQFGVELETEVELVGF